MSEWINTELERIAVLSTKAQTDRRLYDEANQVRILQGPRGEIPPPVNYQQMVGQFRSWMYAACTINANAAASVPLRLYIRATDADRRTVKTRPVPRHRKAYIMGDAKRQPSTAVMRKAAEIGDDFEEVTTAHPILMLLRNANPWMDGFNQTVSRFLWLQLTGNAYLHPIIGEGGVPAELWPMPPQNVEIVPGKEPSDPWVMGYVYGQRTDVERFFEADEVIHFRRPNPGTGISSMHYGMGVVEAAWSALSLHNQKRRHDVATFENNARPDFAIIAKPNDRGAVPSAEDLARFENQIDKRLRGAGKAGRPFAMSGNIDIKPLTFAPKDLGDQTRVLEEIAAVTGVPVSMLLANDPNLASAEQGFANWRGGTILPMLTADEEVLNQTYGQLWPDFEGNAMLAYDNPVPEDEAANHTRLMTRVTTGVITVDEARAELGLEPRGGKADQLPVEVEQQADPLASLFTFGRPSQASQLTGPRLAASLTPVGKYCKAFDEHLKADAADTVREEDETPIQRAIRQIAYVLAQQEAAILAEIQRGKRKLKRERLADLLEPFGEDLQDAMRPLVRQVINDGAVNALSRIDAASDVFSVQNPNVSEFIDNYTVRLAGSVQDSTLQAVSSAIGRAEDEGLTPRETAELVRETGQFDPKRSEVIARTESARAFVRGEELGWQESGVVTGKKWLLAPGSCPTCKTLAKVFNDREQPLGLGEAAFKVGDQFTAADGSTVKVSYEDIAGPPGHPNCRCDLIPVM